MNSKVLLQKKLIAGDDEKEQKNISKHGIDFSTAALLFNDDYRIEKYQP